MSWTIFVLSWPPVMQPRQSMVIVEEFGMMNPRTTERSCGLLPTGLEDIMASCTFWMELNQLWASSMLSALR